MCINSCESTGPSMHRADGATQSGPRVSLTAHLRPKSSAKPNLCNLDVASLTASS